MTRARREYIHAVCVTNAFNRYYSRMVLRAIAAHLGHANVSVDDVLLGRVPDMAIVGFRNPPADAFDVPLGGWYENVSAFLMEGLSPMSPTSDYFYEKGMQFRLFATAEEAAASQFLEECGS